MKMGSIAVTDIILRKFYLAGDYTAEEYYGQFVTEGFAEHVIMRIGQNSLINSKNEHLNDIPLPKWYGITIPPRMRQQIKYAEGNGDPRKGILSDALSVTICKYAVLARLPSMKLEALLEDRDTTEPPDMNYGSYVGNGTAGQSVGHRGLIMPGSNHRLVIKKH